MTSQSPPIQHLVSTPVTPSTTRRRSRHLGWPLAFGVALLAGAGALWSFGHPSSPPAAAALPPPLVTVSRPLARTVARFTDFTGQFSAVDDVALRAQVSGYLTEIHVADGQMVHKGDLLFVIDPRPYAIALQRAAAQYQSAVAGLDLANKEVTRSTVLSRENFSSHEELDQRVQTQLAAQASIDQAQAAIHAAQLNLDFTRITAPFDGRVSNRRVSIGSLVSGGAGASGSTLLTSEVSLDPIHLDFDMTEADYLAYARSLASHQPGLDRTVKVSLGDETGFPHQGTLDFIDNEVDRGSGTMHARATLSNPDLLIAPGQFARLRLPISAPRPVLLVPDAALVTDQSRKLLMVVGANGIVTGKPVQLGALEAGDLREITGGLAANDDVVVDGLMRVRPGAKVLTQQK